MARKKRRRRRPSKSEYTYKPWDMFSDCINPKCKSPRVAMCEGMRTRAGNKVNTLSCNDCGLELPEDEWKQQARNDNRTTLELYELSKRLLYQEDFIGRFGMKLAGDSGRQGRRLARRVLVQEKGEGEMASKKKAKKGKKTEKKTETEKRTKTTYPGRHGAQDDPRLPKVGKVLTATYKGREIKVKRMSDGFRYKGKVYSSLSKAAQVATKQPSVNGFLFFGLNSSKPKAAKKATKSTKKGKKARRVKA